MSQSRQLAAIMFTDIVGYTALMQADEQIALKFLNRFKETLEKTAPEFQGKIVQYFGDGCLLAFDSSSDSVECAMALQKSFIEAPMLPVRIGIHLGDVIFRNENVFGDGVNLASRIESLGTPGSILLSKSIRDHVKNNLEIKLTSLGSFNFKNVEDEIEVFAVSNSGFIVPKQSELQGKLKNEKQQSSKLIPALLILLAAFAVFFIGKNFLQSKKTVEITDRSIAILPLDNLSNESEQDYFIDGLTEDIIDRLARIKNLRVISKTSIMNYKDSKLSIPEIARELSVKYILEGSVRKIDNNIRVVVQLIDGETDKHLWSTTLNKTYDDIFKIQSEIAASIAQFLKISLSDDEKGKLVNIPTKSIEAYDFYLQARKLSLTRRPEDSEIAAVLYHQALQLDPEYADALAALALVYWDKGTRWRQGSIWIDSALFYSNKSIKIDPENGLGYYALGYANNNRRGLGGGMPYFLKSSQLGYALANSPIGAFYLNKKDSRPDSAYFYFHKGLRMDPNDQVLCLRLGNTWDLLGNYDSAKYYYDKSYYLNPDQIDVKFALVSCFIRFRKLDEGINYIRKNLLSAETNEQILERSLIELAKIYAFKGQYDSTKNILTKAKSLKESFLMAMALKELGKEAEAKKMIEQLGKNNVENPSPSGFLRLAILNKDYDTAVKLFLEADDLRLARAMFEDPLFLKIESRPEIKNFREKSDEKNKQMIKSIENNEIVIE